MVQQTTDEHLPSNASVSPRTRGKKALILTLVVGLLVATALIIPLLVNREAVKNVLVREVEQRTGHRLVFEDLEVRLFPRPRVELHDVKVFEQQSEALLLSAKHVDVALQVGPQRGGQAACGLGSVGDEALHVA